MNKIKSTTIVLIICMVVALIVSCNSLTIVSPEQKLTATLTSTETPVPTATVDVQATATAEYLQCSEKFKNKMVDVLDRFFRKSMIADVTARINLPEQISGLEDIRNESRSMTEKSCQPKIHSLLMDYIDKKITAYINFSKNGDHPNTNYIATRVSLTTLNNEIIKTLYGGGLIGLFEDNGYTYPSGEQFISIDTKITQSDKEDGTYLVNIEIAPGTWKSMGDSNKCFSVIGPEKGASRYTYERTITISSTDYQVKFSNCGTWQLVSQP